MIIHVSFLNFVKLFLICVATFINPIPSFPKQKQKRNNSVKKRVAHIHCTYIKNQFIRLRLVIEGSSWSWSYGRWVYATMQSVLITTNAVSSNPNQAECTRYSIVRWSLSVSCDRCVVFSGHSGFLHQ